MIAAALSFLKALAGMAIVLSIWYGIQAFVRRQSGKPGEDMLEHMVQGCCGGCENAGKCAKTNVEREHHHHELA
jgi:hypothetical protein